ncbi:TetR/AcrR family transcriptional regulator [Paraliobacillus sp. JSM ZJ581]|uniref:TetR/AcrR family transcriptional regulator n=1 Tax=Paraliobacillus sp. JSM ZJ581 TaxID=3342118 RepID=UPI0035A8C155
MDGFERRKEKKIKQIFSASFELVMKHGFDKVRVDEIARKARVSPATIYNYFGTKEELYQLTFDNWIDSKLREYEEVLNSKASFNEKIKDLMNHEIRNIKVLTNLSQQNPESVHYFLPNLEEKLESFYLNLIKEGKRDGYISSHYSEQILKKYFKLFFREINEDIHTKNDINYNEEIEQLLQLVFHGLSSKQK